jgi:hypothetical protein
MPRTQLARRNVIVMLCELGRPVEDSFHESPLTAYLWDSLYSASVLQDVMQGQTTGMHHILIERGKEKRSEI